jgi:dTDP-4-dehydrorhamnose 3,5-epimerase|tara:strand:+ start:296 stop:727 length:432 start_codon:yes stop_codon:yes gene_type:complete
MINGVLITPLKIIKVNEGDVFHGIKSSDKGYFGFGEAYFSSIKSGQTKGWKRHQNMTLNIIVPSGEIQFVMFDDRNNSEGRFQDIVLSLKNYCRLTIPPMVWMAFKGLSDENSLLLNVASIPHDPTESEVKKLDEIKYTWRDE